MEYKETGGGRVGFLNATWPMVNLTVRKDHLIIDGKVVGRMVFKKSDVISIEAESSLIGSGIRVFHKRRDIDKKVIFWSKNSSVKLLKSIEEVGFIPGNIPLTENEKELIKERDKFPLRLKVLIPYIVCVALAIYVDFKVNPHSPLHYSIIVSLVSFFLVNVLLQVSKKFRELILVKGKTKDDVGFVSLLLIFATLYNLFVYTMKGSFF